MALLSMRARKRSQDIALTALVGGLTWILQLTVLTNLTFQEAVCNLPLTLTILWGFVFGSPMPPIAADELRTKSAGEIFLHQLLSGSVSGALVGGFLGALYASV